MRAACAVSQGAIPETLNSLGSLLSLRLSNNLLSGPIPSLYSATALSVLELSGNAFSGPVDLSTHPTLQVHE